MIWLSFEYFVENYIAYIDISENVLSGLRNMLNLNWKCLTVGSLSHITIIIAVLHIKLLGFSPVIDMVWVLGFHCSF